MTIKKLLFIVGTRPEIIKCAPVIAEFRKHPDRYHVEVCFTGQHRELALPIIEFFNMKIDRNLDLMTPNQTLSGLTASSVTLLEQTIQQTGPDVIFVQGDTTTAFTGGLAGYYNKIKVAHIEAGLRSNDKYAPFPEEINRKLIGHIAQFHFAPTEKAMDNLRREGITGDVWNVGNSAIDALLWGLDIIRSMGEKPFYDYFKFLDFSQKIILVTGHRRESFGKGFENICNALKHLAKDNPSFQFVYPVHLNPQVQKPVYGVLSGLKNVFLIEPLAYSHFIWLMNKSYLVLTDSGGVQEEAPSLGKPVLVMRTVTERTEGIESGNAWLIGTECENIVNAVTKLIKDRDAYQAMVNVANPYGNGTTSRKMVEIMNSVLPPQ